MSFKKLRRQHAQRSAQESLAIARAITKTLEAVLTPDRLAALNVLSVNAVLSDDHAGLSLAQVTNADALVDDLYRITGLERPQ